MPTLIGRKCRLRPLQKSDLVRSIEWRRDPATRAAVLGYRFPVTEAMEERWYEQVLADQGGRRATFALEDCSDDAHVGFVHLNDIDWPCRSAHFGIVIGDETRRGRGIGTEATKLALAYAFETLNLERIELRVIDTNTQARDLYRRLGFVEEGRLRRAAFDEGAAVDVIVMGLLRGEYIASGARRDP